MGGEWQEVTLGQIFKVKHGFAFSGEFFADEPKDTVLVTPGNFAVGGGFQSRKRKYYSGPVPEGYVLKPGQVVVTMTDLSKESDTLGYAATVPSDAFVWLHNQRVGLLEFKSEFAVDPRFFEYLLRTYEYRAWVVGSASGTTVKHTSPSRIESYKAHIPPFAEQRAIAHILGSLDDKIELLRKQNETLEEMARTLFKAWFVDFEPVRAKMDGRWQRGQSLPGMPAHLCDLFPDRFVESEFGEIPEGWGMASVDGEFDVTMGQSPPGDTYNETGEGLPFYQGSTDFQFRFPKKRVYCAAPTRLAKWGDTLVSVRAPVGAINMASEDCAIGRGVAAIRHKSECKSYTFQFMNSMASVFERFNAEGTVFGSIGKKDFQSIVHLKPSLDLVLSYEKQVVPLDDQIERNERESRTLTQLRDTLLPKLISGELRVPDAERIVGAAA